MQPRILVKGNFDFDSVRVQFNSTSKWAVSEEIRAKADKIWGEKLIDLGRRGIKVWDGDCYRLDNLDEVLSTTADQSLNLELSVIKYRYVNTIRDIEPYYETHPGNYPNHVSVGAMIKTSDSKWVFGLRGKSNTHNNNIDLIGGGLQKNELVIHSGKDIYHQLLNEFSEEAGILPAHIENSTGIGIVHSAVSNVILIALTRLNVSSKELGGIFAKRSDDEMQDLVFVEDSEIANYLSQMTSYRTLIPTLMN